MNYDLSLLKGASKASYDAFVLQSNDPIYTFMMQHYLDYDGWLKLYQFNHNRYRRASRLADRVYDYVLSGKAIFLTLTFRDDVLASTSVETRRRYVSRFLKEQCLFYAANIDFGSRNSREHYHAIVVPKTDSLDLQRWSYGANKAERVHPSETDIKKTSKYVTKLTCHAIKESTGHAYRIIYSR